MKQQTDNTQAKYKVYNSLKDESAFFGSLEECKQYKKDRKSPYFSIRKVEQDLHTTQLNDFKLDNIRWEFKKWLNTQDRKQIKETNTDKIFVKFINWMLKQPGLYSQISNTIWEYEKNQQLLDEKKCII